MSESHFQENLELESFKRRGSCLDTRGLRCPEPLMLLRHRLRAMRPGERLLIYSDDPASPREFLSYCRYSGHRLQPYRHNISDGEAFSQIFILEVGLLHENHCSGGL